MQGVGNLDLWRMPTADEDFADFSMHFSGENVLSGGILSGGIFSSGMVISGGMNPSGANAAPIALDDNAIEDFLGNMFDEFFPGLDAKAQAPEQQRASAQLAASVAGLQMIKEEPLQQPLQQQLGPTQLQSHELLDTHLSVQSEAAARSSGDGGDAEASPSPATSSDQQHTTTSAPQQGSAGQRQSQRQSQSQRSRSGRSRRKSIESASNLGIRLDSPSRATPVHELSVRGTRKEVLRLEKEVREKLAELEKLEEENSLLRRREKLLQLSVAHGDKSFTHADAAGFSSHLANLMLSFKGKLSRVEGQRLLAMRLPRIKDPRAFTIEDFRQAMKSYNDEVSAMFIEFSGKKGRPPVLSPELAHDPEWCALYEPHSQRIQNFLMAVFVNCPMVMDEVYSTNLQTGEREEIPDSHWEKVMSKVALSKEQICDMVAAYELFDSCLNKIMEEQGALAQALQPDVASQTVHERSPMAPPETGTMLAKLQANFARASVMEMMETFLGFSLMTTGQRGVMTLVTWPYFPNLHSMLLVVYKKHGAALGRQHEAIMAREAAGGTKKGSRLGRGGISKP